MLEQAVYAGRNHALSLAVAVIATLGVAGPAQATDVARVPLGEAIRTLVVGPDGGAWVAIQRPGGSVIGRIAPGGGLATVTAVAQPLSGDAALGPDGLAWFGTQGDALLRADGAGAVSPVALGSGYL